ncbi:metallophosphoesterase [Sphingomonas mesophila]|uniref:metallophosphoesterase n=1 Tax=Sphingomonas mesophila TaxID=2303576 RepID=UPI000E574B2A|nr:metallophosphoesterase [Sphingomonas mesophila]
MVSFWSRDRTREPRTPPGVRLYAVGDIHGHDMLLRAMLEAIRSDIEERPKRRNIVVFVGDLIDRGPDSAIVVERLRTLEAPFRPVFLTGNHEEVLLRILEGNDGVVRDWLRFGGLECAASYGLDPSVLRNASDRAAGEMVRKAIPGAHRSFLRGFADSFAAGDYLFVHAGVRPGVPIEEQSITDLRWIRSPFLEHEGRHPKVVVHGHTISSEVECLPGRIGIDTGAYRSGILSAIALDGCEQRIIQVGGQQ